MRTALLSLAVGALLAGSVNAQVIVPGSALPARGAPAAGDTYLTVPNGGGAVRQANITDLKSFVLTSVRSYGAVGNGSTDDAPAINAAIAAAEAAGGGKVELIPGAISAIGSTLAITASNVSLVCPVPSVHGYNGGVAYGAQGCGLKWIGASGGTMMTIIAPSGSTTDQQLVGDAVLGVNFYGNSGLAANGLLIESLVGGQIENTYFSQFNGGVVFDMDVVHGTSATFGLACDSQFNNILNLSIQQFGYTSVGLKLGSWVNSSLSNGGCDASLNYFDNVDIAFQSAEAITFIGGDNNFFVNTRTYELGSGVYGLDFNFYNSGSLWYPANGNTFFGYTSNAVTIARGQATESGCLSYPTTHTVSLTDCTFANQISNLDKTNTTPDPVLEAGAELTWNDNTGPSGGSQMSGPMAVGDTYIDQLLCDSQVGVYSLVVCNGNDAHILIGDQTLANSWALSLNGANLRAIPEAGSGSQLQVPTLLATISVTAPYVHTTPTTIAGLATLDPSPSTGDRALVTDAAACTFGSTPMHGTGTTVICPVIWNSAAWIAG